MCVYLYIFIYLYIEDSDLKFDDKCCKKSGVPDQCMGLCKERIPNQNAAIMFPVDQCDEHLDKIKKCMKKGKN